MSNSLQARQAGRAIAKELEEASLLMSRDDRKDFLEGIEYAIGHAVERATGVAKEPAKHAPSIRQPDPMKIGNAEEMLEFYQLHIRNNPSDADAIPVIAHVSSEVTWNSAMVRLNIMEWEKYYEAEGTEPRFRRSALKFFQSMQHLDVPPKPTARPPSKEDAAAASKAAAHAQWAEYDAEQAARKGAK